MNTTECVVCNQNTATRTMPSLRDSRNTIAACNVCAYKISHKRIVWDKQKGFTKVSN